MGQTTSPAAQGSHGAPAVGQPDAGTPPCDSKVLALIANGSELAGGGLDCGSSASEPSSSTVTAPAPSLLAVVAPVNQAVVSNTAVPTATFRAGESFESFHDVF